MNMNMNIVIRGMIDKYGHKNQTIVAIEELAELQKELTKYLRGEGNHDHLVEEFADVNIMLIQISEMYNLTDREVWEAIDFKIDRMQKDLEYEFTD